MIQKRDQNSGQAQAVGVQYELGNPENERNQKVTKSENPEQRKHTDTV